MYVFSVRTLASSPQFSWVTTTRGCWPSGWSTAWWSGMRSLDTHTSKIWPFNLTSNLSLCIWPVYFWLSRTGLGGLTVTGRLLCRFPCGRWLGKGVDDGSLERVLIGEIQVPCGDEDAGRGSRTPPMLRSPSQPRRISITSLSGRATSEWTHTQNSTTLFLCD